MHKISRENNFDLIRLLAALQVLFWHGCVHFDGMFDRFHGLLRIAFSFPGVPIFFTISGFLIYHSFGNNKKDIKKYLRNRFLRIYPALWFCVALTVFLLLLSADVQISYYFSAPFFFWLAAQLTFFQFYAADALKSWGVGHPNGSLWTITVEIQFYLLLPVLAYLFDQFLNSRLAKNIFYALLLAIGIILKYILLEEATLSDSLIASVYGVTVICYLHHFCLGILIYINFDKLKTLLENKAAWWLTGYVCYVLLFKEYLGWYNTVYDPTFFGFIGNVLLSMLTISFAFTAPGVSEKLLRGNDLSYGIYIFHMPVVNYFLATGIVVTVPAFAGVCFLVVLIAFFSWKVIEKPALRLKSKRST